MSHSANSDKAFATTFGYLSWVPKGASRTRQIKVPESIEWTSKGGYRLSFDEFRLFFRILRAAFQENALLIYLRGPITLFTIAVLGLLPKRVRPTIVLVGRVVNPSKGLRNILGRILMKSVIRTITFYVVYSTSSIEILSKLWNVEKSKIRVGYYYMRILDSEVDLTSEAENKYIFSGGVTERDFETILKAARRLPKHNFLIGTKNLDEDGNIPRNVKIYWPPEVNEFRQYVHDSQAVIIPIKTDGIRVVGLMGLLEAMWLKTPVVIANGVGIEDYVQDRETAIIVDGTVDSYVNAINWVLNPNNAEKVNKICDQAYSRVMKEYTLERYVDRMIDIMDEAMEIEE